MPRFNQTSLEPFACFFVQVIEWKSIQTSLVNRVACVFGKHVPATESRFCLPYASKGTFGNKY